MHPITAYCTFELIQREDCIECCYLGICHGGCPVRAYAVEGDLNRKNPYCPVYLTLFEGMENLAAAAGPRP